MHDNDRWLLGAMVLAFLVLYGAISPASAQQVRGVVVDRATGEPLVGAYVALDDGQGSRRAADLASETGTFSLRAPGPGGYTLRVERIGYETWTSDRFTLADGETVSRRLAVPVRAVHLPELAVEAERRCDLVRAGGSVTERLWEEARKSLRVAAWTEQDGAVSLAVQRYERRIDPSTGRILRDERREWTRTGRRAFRSLTADQLSAGGYVRERGEGHDYYAPDAEALLSDAFLRDHCFEVDTRRLDDGLVGLAFEPVERRDVPEITGTLWLDAASAAVDRLDYRYVNVDLEVAAPDVGGRVEFARLPAGHTIVRRWWIQMPVIGRGQGAAVSASGLPGGGVRFTPEWRSVLVAYRREGGEVAAVTGPEGERRELADWGAVEGVLRDGLHESVLAGAHVRLAGTGYAAESDAEGRFHLRRVAPGRYRLAVEDLASHLLGAQTPATVEVTPDQTAEVEYATPVASDVLARVCPEMGEAELPFQTRPGRRSALIGYVRDGDGSAVADAEVRASVQAYWLEEDGGAARVRQRGREYVARTNTAGAYALCDLPGDWNVQVRVVDGDRRTAPARLTTPSYGLTRLDLAAPVVDRGMAAGEPRVRRGADAFLRGASPALELHHHRLSRDAVPSLRSELAADTAARAAPGAAGGADSEARADAGDVPADAVGSLEEVAERLRRGGEGATRADTARAPAASEAEMIGTVEAADTGEPLPGARVRLLEADRTVTAGGGGRFHVDELKAGAHRLVVEHLGYWTDTAAVSLEAGTTADVRLRAAPSAVELPGLEVTVARTVRDRQLRGFYRRMERGMGRFASKEDIEEWGVMSAVRRMPNTQIRPCFQNGIPIAGCYRLTDVARGSSLNLRGGCSPTIYLDGIRLGRGDEATGSAFEAVLSLPPESIEGIEVHESGTAPARFGGSGGGCGVMLVWTSR